MTVEIINSDGSRNWQANILLDNIKRLEQENEELRKIYNENLNQEYDKRQALEQENKELKGRCQKLSEDLSCSNGCLRNKMDIERIYRSALEEIRGKVNQSYQMADRHIVLNIINEVLQ